MKIFGIGLNKTGTTSLGSCLSILGYDRHVSCRKDLLLEYRKNHLDHLFDVVDNNVFFEDWPWPLVYKEMFFRYGQECRFILTTRKSSEAWLKSLKKHSLITLPAWHCRRLSYGYSFPHGYESYHLDFYERHNDEVRSFFKEQQAEHLLLEFSFDKGDSWAKLCNFLNKPLPREQIPHENKSEDADAEDRKNGNLAMIEEQEIAISIRTQQPSAYSDIQINQILDQLEAGIPAQRLCEIYKIDEQILYTWAARNERVKSTLVKVTQELTEELLTLKQKYEVLRLENDQLKALKS